MSVKCTHSNRITSKIRTVYKMYIHEKRIKCDLGGVDDMKYGQENNIYGRSANMKGVSLGKGGRKTLGPDVGYWS